MNRLPLIAAAGYLATSAAYAMPPPEGAKALSEILAMVEEAHNVAWIDEVDWDEDGYWEIEFYTTDGAKVEIMLDPITGEPRR